ncbi:Serine/threonine-protein kinase ATR [Aphelenchoides fujianensis]|nr:Serine/threonine-protein kinase ATR [Aphelenchoides fujianensis]
MKQVYAVAGQKDRKIPDLLKAYEFLAERLMLLANSKERERHGIVDLSQSFGDLLRFFDPQSAGLGAPPAKKKRGPAPPSPSADSPLLRVPEGPVQGALARSDHHPAIRAGSEGDAHERPPRSDWICTEVTVGLYSVLCKPDDDLGKDACYMDLANMLNARMSTNKHTRNEDLHIQTFGVLPLQEQGGLIEWVHGMTTLGECLRATSRTTPLWDQTVRQLEKEARSSRMLQKRSSATPKIASFRKCCELSELTMSKYLRSRCSGPASFYHLQRRFTISTAMMSAFGYLVPFRLTRNIVDGFGAVGIEGRFRFSMERSMRFLQSEKAAILICLQGFLNDPLLKWQAREERGEYDIKVKSDFIENRLNGFIHSNKFPKSGPYSARELVAKLIETAMDEKILASMYMSLAVLRWLFLLFVFALDCP